MRVNNSSLSFTQGRIQLLWLHASMTSCTRKGSTLGDLSPLYLFCCYKFLKTSRKMLPLFCFSKCPPPTLARSIGTPQASWTGCEPYGDILFAQVISDKMPSLNAITCCRIQSSPLSARIRPSRYIVYAKNCGKQKVRISIQTAGLSLLSLFIDTSMCTPNVTRHIFKLRVDCVKSLHSQLEESSSALKESQRTIISLQRWTGGKSVAWWIWHVVHRIHNKTRVPIRQTNSITVNRQVN